MTFLYLKWLAILASIDALFLLLDSASRLFCKVVMLEYLFLTCMLRHECSGKLASKADHSRHLGQEHTQLLSADDIYYSTVSTMM